MKKINKFLNEANLFKIWLVVYLITSLFVTALFYGLDYTLEDYTFSEDFKYFYLGALMSLPFTTLFTLTISMSRKSIIFWDYAKELQERIDNVKTKEELEHIWYNEYNELIKKCQGGAQIGEVKRVKAIIETGLKYLK